MHRGRVWKPRAATVDISGKDISDTLNPGQVDGDHVLIGFLDNNWNEPIILRGLPHPMQDEGLIDDDVGHRIRLKLTDGDPDFLKHHGSFYGIDNSGNFVVDTTQANQGEIDQYGHEPDAPTDGKGNWDIQLPENAKIHVKINNDETLTIEKQGSDAILTLGDGAVKVAIADHLETLYSLVKTWLSAHTHKDSTGGETLPSTQAGTLPSWDSKINSDKITCPDT